MNFKTKDNIKEKIQTFEIFNGRVMQPWMRRAMHHPEFRTKDNESVRSGSVGVDDKEVLFPTIRMRGPGLEKLTMKQAFKEAMKRKDYLEFRSPQEAVAYSRSFSSVLGRLGREPEVKPAKSRRPKPDNLKAGYLLK